MWKSLVLSNNTPSSPFVLNLLQAPHKRVMSIGIAQADPLYRSVLLQDHVKEFFVSVTH